MPPKRYKTTNKKQAKSGLKSQKKHYYKLLRNAKKRSNSKIARESARKRWKASFGNKTALKCGRTPTGKLWCTPISGNKKPQCTRKSSSKSILEYKCRKSCRKLSKRDRKRIPKKTNKDGYVIETDYCPRSSSYKI